ncbi:homoserine dehydrogenase [Candidatus Bathyarchaeota archaeon]|nr:homoserine dehydrogenase [Candidatus Bathyarchaeota archaeon]
MRIILVGWGVVGQSFANIIIRRRKELTKEYGFRPKIVAIVDKKGAAINPKGLDLEQMLNIKKEKGTVSANSKFGHPKMSALEVLESVEAEVMIEMSPTNIEDGEPGLSFMKTAFRTGKHVVTTNKGPLALALPALTELADFNKVCLRFSGTVGAGTPVLEFAKNCLKGDNIVSIQGILNGTTNYILSEMDENQLSFNEALSTAQKLGFAETDPTMDVDGYDAAAKLVIMANWILNKKVTLKDVKIKGIRGVSAQNILDAKNMGCTMKLIGSIDDILKVEPKRISKDDPLAVNGALNAVTFVSESAGEQTIIGLGAGGEETGSAILRDLLDIKRTIAKKMIN